MITIKANLRSCVNDMTQQGRQGLFEKYFQTTFTKEQFTIRVKLDGDTFKVFQLHIQYFAGNNEKAPQLTYNLFTDNGPSDLEPVFKGVLTVTQNMTVLSGILCALHVCGDYIKFAFYPISLESEENHNA